MARDISREFFKELKEADGPVYDIVKANYEKVEKERRMASEQQATAKEEMKEPEEAVVEANAKGRKSQEDSTPVV